MIETYVDNKDYIEQRYVDLYNKLNIDIITNNINLNKKITELNNYIYTLHKTNEDNINKLKIEIEELKNYIKLPWYKKLFSKRK